MTIAALRALLDQEQPHVPRHPAPWIPHTERKRQEHPLSHPIPEPAGPPPLESPPKPEPLPVDKLLAWAASHDDKTVQANARNARACLDTLRARHQADNELAQIDAETRQLEQRLAELRAREAELAPKRKAAKARDHDPAVVRAWARANNIAVPALGRVPKAVVDAWRQRTDT